ncbi:MAG TPA: hypothetical protein VJP78_08120, partial [Thermoleophilia bacterium]|nr:hypothetical protein [Thermoleophilia bacterium]
MPFVRYPPLAFNRRCPRAGRPLQAEYCGRLGRRDNRRHYQRFALDERRLRYLVVGQQLRRLGEQVMGGLLP